MSDVPEEVKQFLAQAPLPAPGMMVPSEDVAAGEEAAQWLAEQERAEKYGTLGQQVITGLEGAAEAATFGLSTGLETALGVKPEDIQARREENPVARGVGQAAGIVGSSLLIPGGGAAGALAKAGQAGVKAAGLAAAETAGQRIAAFAIKEAIEGAAFQAGDEVSKMFLKDPNQSVQTAAINVGLAGVLGGALGGGMGATGELWNATVGKKVGKALANLSDEMNAPARTDLSPNKFEADMLQEGMATPSQEVIEAAQRHGIRITDATKVQSEFAKKLESSLTKRGTAPGASVAEEVVQMGDDMAKVGEDLLKSRTVKTEYEVGKEVKEGVLKRFKDELTPVEAEYKALKPELKKITPTMGAIAEAQGKILDNEMVKISPELQTLAEKLAERIKNTTDLDQLKIQRTLLNEELSKAYRAGGPEVAILKDAKDAMTTLRDRMLTEAEASGMASPGVLKRIRDADTNYRAIKDKLKAFGVEAGLGNVNSARDLLKRFEKISNENFATRVFDLNDVNQLRFMRQMFPEQYNLARRYKLQDLYEKSLDMGRGKGGKFDIGKFLRQVDDTKLGPEAREMLFETGIDTIKDLRTIYSAMPADINPSGTAGALSFGDMFSLQGVYNNASDAVKYALLKSMPYIKEATQGTGGGKAAEMGVLKLLANVERGAEPGAFKQLVEFAANTIKGENTLSKATKAVFEAGSVVLPSKLLPNDEKRKKLDKKLREVQSNNERLLEVGGKVAHYDPEVGSSIGFVASNATNFLNSLRPATERKSPLDSDIEPSKAEQAHYERALDIAEQPLVVLQAIKDGEVTPDDIMAMQRMYPDLYARVHDKLTTEMIEALNRGENVPYKTRIGLSMFLGEPMDSTLTPMGIQAAQPKMGQGQAQQVPQQKYKGSMKDLGTMAKADMTPLQARQMAKN